MAAVAQQRRAGAGQLAAVGRVQLATGRVDHARVLGRRQPAAPFAGRLVERQRETGPAGVAGAARQRPGDGPADIALGVAGDHVLRRDAQRRRQRQRLLQRVDQFEPARVQVGRLRRVRAPLDRVGVAERLAQRAERGFAHRQRERRRALDQDGLPQRARGFPAGAGAQLAGPRRVALQRDQVEVVGVAVGVAPGEVAVAAHHHHRRARQRHADHAARPALRVGELQRGAVPGVGQLYAQVHVVGDQGGAVARAAAGQRPVVAADRVDEVGRGQRRRRRLRQLGRADATGRRRRQRPAPPGRRARRNGGRLGGRLGAGRRAGRVQRHVPQAALRRQEIALRRVAVLRQPAARQLAPLLRALQVEVHGPDHQQRVGRRPGARRRADQRVFEGPRSQALQAGVDAVDVALQQQLVGRRQGRQRRLGAGAEAVQAVALVGGDGALAEQLGQLAGRHPAQQVHLEVALLGVHETGGVGHVVAAGAADQRHAQRVAGDADAAVQTGHAARAVELGQAGAQEQPPAQRRQHHQQQQAQRGAPGPSSDSTSLHATPVG